MKKILLFTCLAVFFIASGFSTLSDASTVAAKIESTVPAGLSSLTADELLNMTPAKYKELTGQKLGIKNTLALKAAQKSVKKQFLKAGGGAPALDKSVYIVLAILIPFVAVGIASDWNGSDWIVALVLSLLCWLPGMIYALVKMKNYY